MSLGWFLLFIVTLNFCNYHELVIKSTLFSISQFIYIDFASIKEYFDFTYIEIEPENGLTDKEKYAIALDDYAWELMIYNSTLISQANDLLKGNPIFLSELNMCRESACSNREINFTHKFVKKAITNWFSPDEIDLEKFKYQIDLCINNLSKKYTKFVIEYNYV